jgi:hypothetical protein
MAVGFYNAEISAGSLMVPESRRIARLLLSHPSALQWDEAVIQENVLQKRSSTAKRLARLIRKRLTTLDDGGWRLIADGDGELTRQLLLAATIRQSRLLSDFCATYTRLICAG